MHSVLSDPRHQTDLARRETWAGTCNFELARFRNTSLRRCPQTNWFAYPARGKAALPPAIPIRQCRARLVDFSIASVLSREAAVAAGADRLEGTLAYIAPEQTGRINRGVDHRTDFYSFGVMLYELVAGRLPFALEVPIELVHAHIALVPRPLHEVSPSVPRALSAVVAKLMAKNARGPLPERARRRRRPRGHSQGAARGRRRPRAHTRRGGYASRSSSSRRSCTAASAKSPT